METTSDRKIDIAKKLLEVKDDSVLDKIEALLSETEVVAYTSGGKPLTRKQYNSRLEKISGEVHSEARTYTSDEVIEYVTKRKP